MLSATDIQFFVETHPHFGDLSPTKQNRLLVTHSRRAFEVATIVDVHKYHTTSSYVPTFVSMGGDYMQGAVVNPIERRGTVVFRNSDGSWGVGTFSSEITQGDVTAFAFRSPRFTDQHKLNHHDVGLFTPGACHMAPMYFRAAAWADELFPALADTEEMVSAKLEQAKLRAKDHWAKYVVTVEALRRGWEDQIDSIKRDDHDGLTPRYSAKIDATINVPIGMFGRVVPTAEQAGISERVAAYSASSAAGEGGIGHYSDVVIPMSFSAYPPNDSHETEQAAREFWTQQRASTLVRTRIRESNPSIDLPTLTSVTVSPIITTTV